MFLRYGNTGINRQYCHATLAEKYNVRRTESIRDDKTWQLTLLGCRGMDVHLSHGRSIRDCY